MTITDASGTVLGTYTSLKAFGNVIYSTSGMTNGSTYTVSVDGTSTEATAGQGGGMGGPMGPGGPGQGGQPPGGRPAAGGRSAPGGRSGSGRVSPRPHPRAEASQ